MTGERKAAKVGALAFFLAPSLICLVLFCAAPMIVSLGISLTDSDMIISTGFVGLENFRAVFSEPRSLLALRNMLLYLVGYLPSVLVISLALALAADSPSMRRAGAVRVILFIPAITSWVTVAIIWKWIFGGRTGLLNFLLGLAGIHGPIWLQDPDYAMYAVLVPTVWKDVGLATTILLAGLDEHHRGADLQERLQELAARLCVIAVLDPFRHRDGRDPPAGPAAGEVGVL